MPHTRKESRKGSTMHYTNHQQVPVYATGGEPLMPCHPARARKLLARGRAVPHHIRGIFGIRLLDRTRTDSALQGVALNIDPGSDTSGLTLVADDHQGNRNVLFAVELKHRAFAMKATLTRRRSFRRNRRGRLRYRAARFDNRTKPDGWLPPSVQSLVHDTIRLVETMRQMFPISSIRIERNKFDPQLMMNPQISGIGYQHGTLHGRQVRAYVMDRDHSRCVYCGEHRAQLELDHVRPRAIGTDRVDNLVTCCRQCNVKKANRPIKEFLADQPELLEHVLERLQRSDLVSAAHVNAALPAIVQSLRATGLPVQLTDAASVSWDRDRFGIPKTHCYDAALQGRGFQIVVSLPTRVIQLRPHNGRSKQKANVDRHGTPVGRSFRQQQQMPKHLRRRNPAAGHSDQRQRYSPQQISTGDTVEIKNQIGRAVIKARGTRVALHRTKPQVSAKTANCRLIARRTGYSIRRKSPAQQEHAKLDR